LERLTAAITGGYIALAIALHKTFGVSPETWPSLGQIAATSVGFVAGVALLDLAYEEDSQAEVDMNVAMTDAGTFVEVQGTAEATPFTRTQLTTLLDLAHGGIEALFATGAVATAGYVLISSRAGLWVIAALTARPLWKQFDPIEILFAWERVKKLRGPVGLSADELFTDAHGPAEADCRLVGRPRRHTAALAIHDGPLT